MPETTAEDDFGSFFDNLSDLAAEKKPVPSDFGAAAVAVTPPVVATEPPVVVVPPDTAVPATTATEPSAATGDVAAPVADPVAPQVAEPAAVKPDATPALLERFVQAMEAQKPAPQRTQPAPQQLYTPEELTTLETFEKDWPDAAKALQLIMRGATTVQRAQTMEQMAATLAPALQNMQTVQFDHQLNSLRQVIPDYDSIREPAIQWATTDKSIPTPLRNTFKNVIEQGEPSDVKWLVDSWRTATGKSVSSTPSPVAAAKPANELSEAAKQAAASLAPVVSKRTAVVSSATPVDFDGAFEHFTAAKKP